MPILSNAKHEHFAQLVAGGEPAQKAYVTAGYSENGAGPSASRLLATAKVAARVGELRETISKRVVEKTAYDLAAAMIEAESARSLAMDAKNPRAAVAAVELKAKLNGLLIDRKEIKTGELDALPPDELRNLRQIIADELAARPAEGDAAQAQRKPASDVSTLH